MPKRYVDHLQDIMSDATPAPATAKTRVQLQTEIEAISGALRGPLINADRLDLVEQRHLLRKQLSALSLSLSLQQHQSQS
jgi:hypothetical protein